MSILAAYSIDQLLTEVKRRATLAITPAARPTPSKGPKPFVDCTTLFQTREAISKTKRTAVLQHFANLITTGVREVADVTITLSGYVRGFHRNVTRGQNSEDAKRWIANELSKALGHTITADAIKVIKFRNITRSDATTGLEYTTSVRDGVWKDGK